MDSLQQGFCFQNHFVNNRISLCLGCSINDGCTSSHTVSQEWRQPCKVKFMQESQEMVLLGWCSDNSDFVNRKFSISNGEKNGLNEWNSLKAVHHHEGQNSVGEKRQPFHTLPTAKQRYSALTVLSEGMGHDRLCAGHTWTNIDAISLQHMSFIPTKISLADCPPHLPPF